MEPARWLALISDAIVDYYGARKLAYEVIKRVQQDVCVMLDEPEDGRQTVVVVNDTLRPVSVDFRVRAGDGVLLAGSTEIDPNGREILGQVPVSTTRDFRQIDWTHDGSAGRNHYLAGPRPFDLNAIRSWYRKAGIE